MVIARWLLKIPMMRRYLLMVAVKWIEKNVYIFEKDSFATFTVSEQYQVILHTNGWRTLYDIEADIPVFRMDGNKVILFYDGVWVEPFIQFVNHLRIANDHRQAELDKAERIANFRSYEEVIRERQD